MGQEASGAIVDAWKGRLVRSAGNLFTGGHYHFSAAGWLRNNPTKLPYIVVLMMSFSVAGGTQFYCDLVRDGQIPRDPRTPRPIQ
jgi:hypothetical protein